MNIILSNDDGVNSNGIIKLAEQLCKTNNVLVVAPSENCSASGHSLSIHKKIKLKKHHKDGYECYSITGTPVDCIKFAKLHFKDFKAEVVVAGINKGHNLGSDILYSGTVSIACEASFFGNVSFAFSTFSLGESDFEKYAIYAERIINALIPYSEPSDIWNINFPNLSPEDVKGVKFTCLGKQIYSDRYERVSENEYVLTGELLEHNENPIDCDVEWVKKGFISITPILLNKTNYKKIDEVKNICIKL